MSELKVMLVNGSPHKNGTTNRALDEVEAALKEDGIGVGRFWVGTKPIAGCLGCGYCSTHNGECVFGDVVMNSTKLLANMTDLFLALRYTMPQWVVRPNLLWIGHFTRRRAAA